MFFYETSKSILVSSLELAQELDKKFATEVSRIEEEDLRGGYYWASFPYYRHARETGDWQPWKPLWLDSDGFYESEDAPHSLGTTRFVLVQIDQPDLRVSELGRGEVPR
jgi:hypothetical protein